MTLLADTALCLYKTETPWKETLPPRPVVNIEAKTEVEMKSIEHLSVQGPVCVVLNCAARVTLWGLLPLTLG